MKHPLWILNSTLLALLIAALLFVLLSQQEVPERESIKPDKRALSLKKETSKINISKIYEYDLFGTYQKEMIKAQEPTFVAPLPQPPTPAPVEIPAPPKPQFLDPLQITLKGIMASGDDSSNIAIILDNKTKRETTFKIGDKIEDAQLLKIFKNKIIFVRSNGQQEIFYLRSQDAQLDPSFANIEDWKELVKKTAPNNYMVNPTQMEQRVKSLGQLIDLLDLTTAYKQGVSIGVRVGSSQSGLAKALGLQTGDIIISIDETPATTTESRLEIYKQVINLQEDDTVKVTLQRGPQTFILHYKLHDFSDYGPQTETQPELTAERMHQIQEEQRKILEKKYDFAPTLKDIKQQERENMFKKGKTHITNSTPQTVE